MLAHIDHGRDQREQDHGEKERGEEFFEYVPVDFLQRKRFKGPKILVLHLCRS
jgi:hypothetical protein